MEHSAVGQRREGIKSALPVTVGRQASHLLDRGQRDESQRKEGDVDGSRQGKERSQRKEGGLGQQENAEMVAKQRGESGRAAIGEPE